MYLNDAWKHSSGNDPFYCVLGAASKNMLPYKDQEIWVFLYFVVCLLLFSFRKTEFCHSCQGP